MAPVPQATASTLSSTRRCLQPAARRMAIVIRAHRGCHIASTEHRHLSSKATRNELHATRETPDDSMLGKGAHDAAHGAEHARSDPPFGGFLRSTRSPTGCSHLFRIVELFVTAPFHAFFGIAFMTSKDEVAGYFANPMVSWHIGALADQRVGGAIAWELSEIPTLLVVLVVTVLSAAVVTGGQTS